MIPGILLDLLIVCILHCAGKPLHQLVLLPFLIQLKNVHKKNTQVSYEASFFNSSPAGQYGRHFADDIFRCIFLNENICMLGKISLEFVPNNPALV